MHCTSRDRPDGPWFPRALLGLGLLLLAACAPFPRRTARPVQGATSASYVVGGRRYYVLRDALGYNQRGIASWYGLHSIGKPTASGIPYNPAALTAASKTLPLGTWVRVTDLVNGRRVNVRIDDRGPFVSHRIIDLSYAAARRLGMIARGTALVDVQAIPHPVLPGAERYRLAPPPLPHNPLGHPPRMYLQVGAYARRGSALALELHLMKKGIRPLRLFPLRRHHRILYILQVGPLGHVRELDRLAQRLTVLGYPNTEVIIR